MTDWVFYDEEYYWQTYDLIVIAERYLVDGTREYLVRGWVAPDTILNNANIYGTE